MFQESFKGFSRKIEGHFNRVLCGFQGGLKKVQWVVEESFKCVSRMFEGNIKGVKRKNEECQGYSKEVQRVFQGSFKVVSDTF